MSSGSPRAPVACAEDRLRRVSGQHERRGPDAPRKLTLAGERFQTLLQRFEATVQEARDAKESIVGSFEVLIARTGHRTNHIMKVLTLTSVIFLPGALLAGVMGMNFHVTVFDHPAIFYVIVTAIALIAPITFLVAKSRDWI